MSSSTQRVQFRQIFRNVRLLELGISLNELGIDDGEKQLGSIEIEDLLTRKVKEGAVRKKAVHFQATFGHLITLNIHKKESTSSNSMRSNNPNMVGSKRPANVVSVAPPAKRAKKTTSSSTGKEISAPLTGPRDTHGDSVNSKGTVTFCDESLVTKFANDFLEDALRCIRDDGESDNDGDDDLEDDDRDEEISAETPIGTLAWCKSNFTVELSSLGRQHAMNFRLGTDMVTAVNDGGLLISVFDGDGLQDWKPSGRAFPVLSLKVSFLFHISDK